MREFTELTIKRNNKFILDTMDYQVLIMLYKPLVGPHAIDLYLSLYELSYGEREVTKSIYYITDIISDFDLKIDDLKKYLNFLKKIQLIKRNGIEIELFPPYSKTEFFELPLVNYLAFNTSNSQFKYLMNRFYGKEIEVKKPEKYELVELEKVLNPNKRKNDTVPFSFEEFVNLVEDEDSKKQLESGRDYFESIVRIYNFSLNDMLNVLYEAECDIVFEKEKFNKKAYEKYEKRLEMLGKERRKTKTDEENIRYLANHTTMEILCPKGKELTRLSESDKSTLKRLRDELHLETPIINLLICYSLAKNEHKLYAFKYYEKVVGDWRKKGIDNVSDAYFYLDDLFSKNTGKGFRDESAEDLFENFYKEYMKERK